MDKRRLCEYSWDVKGLLKAVKLMLKMSGEDETSTPLNGPRDHGSTSSSILDEEDQMALQFFRACADPGRKRSLRSLEIPLDNLLSGIIYIPGGRDKRGGPILLLTQPDHLDLETLMEMTHQDFFDMLAYFTSVPSEESRKVGFSVIIDGEVIHDFLLRLMIKALAIMQSEEKLFHKVYFVSSVRDITLIDWKTEYCGKPDVEDLPFKRLKNRGQLLLYTERNQLPVEFGGTLSYNHQDWVRFRMQVEPFLCDCISISKRLAQAIEPFTDESIPDSIEQVEETIHKHRLIRRKTLEVLHIEELESEGSRIDQHMHQTASNHLAANPDFSNTLGTISNLLAQISTVKDRVETLWTTRHEKLQTNLKQKRFETEANKVIEWFEEYAEEFFQTHTELGESLDVSLALAEELQNFEDSTKEIVSSSNQLVSSGGELEKLPYTNKNTVQPLMGKIKQLVTDFDSRLSKRKKKLDDSVRLHRLTETSLDWCIESAVVLSGSDMLSATSSNPEQSKRDLDHFLTSYPPPTDQDLQHLLELIEQVGAQWIKDNALFAYNRVVEVKERFRYYSKMLNDAIEKRRLELQQQLQQEKMERQLKESEQDMVDGSQKSSDGGKSVRLAEALLVQMASSGEEEPESVFLESKSIQSRQMDRVNKHRSQEMSNSLHYDDLGVDHALMLLKSVAKSADAKLHSPPHQGLDETDMHDTLMRQSDSSSSLSHRITKQDISQPTKTTGPLFKTGKSLDSDEEDDWRAMTATEQRQKIAMMPCPVEESLKNQTKQSKHRRKLMEELIQTEETYIRDMEWVVEHYMPAMDDINSVPRNLVGKKNLIFSTIPHLLHFNKLIILPQLKQLSKCPVKLGRVFMTMEEDLLNYSLYFKNLPQQTRLMEEGGIEFFADVSRRIDDRFLLNSYLIKPFQRITKYKIFIEEMIKYSTKADMKGKLKEYYDKLKEAQKMVDFILRHGNDLLAVECLRGHEGNMREHGKILRQGDLTLVEYTKHHRRVFLFEHTIILTKKRKSKHHVHEVASSDIFDFKQAFKTSDYGLRENVDGHATRFQLYKKKETLTFQAETLEEKNMWVQDIWDLFFSHMLSLKDLNLEAHGSNALTSIAATGSATIGRSFGHSLRRAMSVRHSSGNRYSREINRPSSLLSNQSAHRLSGGGLSIKEESSSTNRHSGTFVDLKSHDADGSASNRSSIISTSSTSTVGSWNPLPPNTSPGNLTNGHSSNKTHNLSVVQLTPNSSHLPPRPHSASPLSQRKEPPLQKTSTLPPSLAKGSSSPGSPHFPNMSNALSISSSSSSSLNSQESLDKTLVPVFDTPV